MPRWGRLLRGRLCWARLCWARLLRGVVVAGIAAVAGCTPVASSFPQDPPALEDVPPAVVTRGDLVSVLAVEGVVVATPRYVLPAPEDEVTLWHGDVKPEAPVQADQPLARQGDTVLSAPVVGYFDDWLVPHGVRVHRGIPVASLHYAGFGVVATVPPVEAYRLYDGASSARAQVSGGPGPTECLPLATPSAVGAAPVGPPSEADAEAGMTVLCAIPKGVDVLAGSPAVLGLTTGERDDVLLLPVQAVAGSAGHGTVMKLTEGAPVLTEVTLGITDGTMVEIVDGLSEGDQVWAYGPDLLPAVP